MTLNWITAQENILQKLFKILFLILSCILNNCKIIQIKSISNDDLSKTNEIILAPFFFLIA